jgi:hypothetical protein
MLELLAYINTSEGPSRRERSERRNSDVHGALIEPIRVRTSRVLDVFLNIYLIDINLNYYQKNSRFLWT